MHTSLPESSQFVSWLVPPLGPLAIRPTLTDLRKVSSLSYDRHLWHVPRQNERIIECTPTFIQLSNSPVNGRQFESKNNCHFDFHRHQVDFIEVWPRRDWRREIGRVWFTGQPREFQLGLIRKLPDRLGAAPLDPRKDQRTSGTVAVVVSVEIEPRYLGKVSGDVPFRELIEYDGNFLHAQHKVLCGSRASHRRHALCRRVFPNGTSLPGCCRKTAT